MGNEVKKLKISEAEEVSGGAKFKGYDAKKGYTCTCEECGKEYFTPGLRWDELGPIPSDIKYQFHYCHECMKRKFPTGYDEADRREIDEFYKKGKN